MTQHTAKFLQAAHIWVWSTPLLISAGWGNHCPKYLGLVDKVSVGRVIRVQLMHWQLCCKTIMKYLSLRAKEDIYIFLLSLFSLWGICWALSYHRRSCKKRKIEAVALPSKSGTSKVTPKDSKETVLQHSFMGVITKDMQIMQRERKMGEEDNIAHHSFSSRVSVATNTFQHAPPDAFHLNSTRKETHGDRTTHGCSAGRKTAWCRLEK